MENEYDLKVIGNVIKEERKFKRFSQLDLANQFNLNQSTISRIENGENISLEIYENILNLFGIKIDGEEKLIYQYLEYLYLAIEFDEVEKIYEIYQDVKKFDKLPIKEFYIKKLIEALYSLFTNQNDAVEYYFKYLLNFKFIYEEMFLKYYYFFYGYCYHLKREYILADSNFINALFYLNKFNCEDNIFDCIFSWNNILLGNYSIAQLFLENAKGLCEKKGNIKRVIHIERLLSYIYFFDNNYIDSIKYGLKFIINIDKVNVTNDMIIISLFILACSYIMIYDFSNASMYLEKIINTINDNKNKELYYSYLLICLKVTKSCLFNHYYEKLQNDEIYQDISKKMIMDNFINHDVKYNNEAFFDKFNILIDKTFINFEDYPHTKLFFSIARKFIWSKRKYSYYKKINDIVIRRQLGEINDEL